MIMHNIYDYKEEHGTIKGYYEQFKNTPTEVVVGELYVVHPDTWQENIVEIVHVFEDVALGVNVRGVNIGGKTLYKSKGRDIGWKYNDGRPSYRLQVRKL